ncbi:acetate/propionate family kinase [Roseitalea porphyridii]|uniref:Acetate kinase n=1 Tax=Roseitalea porphyridii TaxID=1852022 RepID=A0A4P6V213_9HYPH|nr:acetate/propionate family kinase [Roseitalea porphyridii]QBK31205.1 acetate/propionate family kinase [Roseitalea porphyridii]
MSDTVILTLNAGSSSIKFAVFEPGEEPALRASGQVENLSPSQQTRLIVDRDGDRQTADIAANDHAGALAAILDHAEQLFGGATVAGVGHRVVHGGTDFTVPTLLQPDTIAALRALEPLAPLHQPHNLACVEAASAAFPDALQIACFDTAFHRTHPFVNDTFALPRQWFDRGVRRYGFHGLSYDYITSEIARTEPDLSTGRVVIAHLGNGASMCAVRDGRSVGSTMGFTALDGLPMGTRCGQIDPGVLLYMMQHEGMGADAIADLLYRESGLKGLSGLTHDMRTLEASDNPRAAEAIDYFVFRIRRELGGMSAVLGGLDALVFTGGIGENSARVRREVCSGMDWLGIAIDHDRNAGNARDIGTDRVRVMVIPTNEELVMARAVAGALSAAH